MGKDRVKVLDEKTASQIHDEAEKTFALATTRKENLEVQYQVRVGSSVIDFRVTNRRSGTSKLVEVTKTPNGKVMDYDRKRKQLRDMKDSGEAYVVLGFENIANIEENLE